VPVERATIMAAEWQELMDTITQLTKKFEELEEAAQAVEDNRASIGADVLKSGWEVVPTRFLNALADNLKAALLPNKENKGE